MLIRYKQYGNEVWENISIESINIMMGLEGSITGNIRTDPSAELGKKLLSKEKMDIEFSREADDDFDVIVLSGVIGIGQSFGSGKGFEEPITVHHFKADNLEVHD